MANIIDSYSETNQNASISIDVASGSNPSAGQSFTGNGGTLGSVSLYLAKTGTPTGTLTAFIYAHSGTYGTSSVPTGAALATSSTIDATTLPTYPSLSLFTFTFSGAEQITLTNGTNYVLVLTISGGSSDASNRPQVGDDSTSPTASGNASRNINGTWSALGTIDVCFYVYDNTSFGQFTTQDTATLTDTPAIMTIDTVSARNPIKQGVKIIG